jgi:hypothetical protein
MNYHIWKQRFIAMVNSQQRLIYDKGKALSTAIDKRKRLMRYKVLVLNNDSQKYAFLIAEVGRFYSGAKQKIATAALDLLEGSKIQLSSFESVRVFIVKLKAYRTTLDTYRIEAEEFAPNGQCNREIKDRKFTQPDLVRFLNKRSSKGCRMVRKEFQNG